MKSNVLFTEDIISRSVYKGHYILPCTLQQAVGSYYELHEVG